MTRLILAAAAATLLLASCGSDTIPIDKAEPAPPAVPAEPIERQPLSAPPPSLTGAPEQPVKPPQTN